MNSKKQKTMNGKSVIQKNNKEQTPKSSNEKIKRKIVEESDSDSDSPSSEEEVDESRFTKKHKKKLETKLQSLKPSDHSLPNRKMTSHDEFQEASDFLKSLSREMPKSDKKKEKMDLEDDLDDDFEIWKKESKRLTHLAFQLFDKIELSHDKGRSKIGTTSIISPNKEQKKKSISKKETMDIEDSQQDKKEENNSSQPIVQTRMRDLLNVDIFDDYDGKNDDLLADINFEPSIETIKKSSSHVDLDKVCSLIEQSKKSNHTEKELEEYIPQQISLTHLPENYQKIKEAVDAVSETDIQRLEPEVYLNDTLINFYLKIIELGLISNQRRNKVHIFNTYFMAKIRKLFADVSTEYSKFDHVYSKLERWTKKLDLFEKDFILIPVNENEHWNLVVLCYVQKLYSNDDELPLVVFLDSICRMEEVYAKLLFNFFSRELKAKKPNEVSIFQEKVQRLKISSLPCYQPIIPKQSNWTDCGLYLIQYAELFCEDESYILKNKEVAYNREINKAKWFPRKVIADKREDMRIMIRELKSQNFDVISDYLERRNEKMKGAAKEKGQFDAFDQEKFESAVETKYSGAKLSDEEMDALKLDFFYFDSLDIDQSSDMHH